MAPLMIAFIATPYRGVEPLTMMFFLKGPLPRSGGGTGLMSKSSQNLAV